jgi:hypothetical protein
MGCPSYWPNGGWQDGLGPGLGERAREWQTNPLFEGASKFKTCDVPQDSEIFRVIAAYVNAAVKASPYKTAKFESARLSEKDQKVHASTVGKFLLTDVDRPEFSDGKYRMTRIKIVNNPTLWSDYEKARLCRPKHLDALKDVSWVTTTVTENGFSFPVINQADGECYLLHGTKESTIKLIAENGFGPEYCNYRGRFAGGYGSLGQGTYLTDNLAKCATYASCFTCKTSGGPCDCKDGDGNEPLERMALIARALILQDTKVTTKKELSYQGQSLDHKPERPMVIGLANKEGTKWPNNVFLVRDKTIVYPEFVVFFQWPRAGFSAQRTMWNNNPLYQTPH